ncbi:hypothetical protein PAAG_05270 [Paracoccidioides lutzii Pb01]|uniref:Uncharacterized protein n=1 Tax=Paracoccidioides lutzii (strain ATCC MYA-826 / Pb01) TaxID=502779 RepID=C1H3C7_PARBA|nr:hypothetical protein PAAG_05270 [Paracoccidioides lutzii Pb01]EEH34221.1 hypothetical protein PAAG_05270 [Paracoccidioides lutzii Pb01]
MASTMAFNPQTKNLASAKAGAGRVPPHQTLKHDQSKQSHQTKRRSRREKEIFTRESDERRFLNRTPGVVTSDSLQKFSSKPPIET